MTGQMMSHVPNDDPPEPPRAALRRSFHAEVSADLLDPQGELIDWLIGYAFDTLDVTQLTLRVTSGATPPMFSRSCYDGTR